MGRKSDITTGPEAGDRPSADGFAWFFMPRLEGGQIENDPLLALHVATHPCPKPLLRELPVPAAVDMPAKNVVNVSDEPDLTESLIDRFLSSTGEHRITPTDATPEYDAAERSGVLEVTDEIATRQLADIYRSQGLDKEADEIIRKLEKSPESGG